MYIPEQRIKFHQPYRLYFFLIAKSAKKSNSIFSLLNRGLALNAITGVKNEVEDE